MGKTNSDLDDSTWNWPETPGQQLLSSGQWDKLSLLMKLSGSEREVCRLMMDGHTRISIASHLGIKVRAVRQHLEHLHLKLRVTNRVGLVLRVIQIRDSFAANEKPI